MESLQLITNALANLQPTPDLPDTRSLVRDMPCRGDDLHRSAVDDEDVRPAVLRFMSKTAHLRALAEAVHECREKANALDWEAWNRDYF